MPRLLHVLQDDLQAELYQYAVDQSLSSSDATPSSATTQLVNVTHSSGTSRSSLNLPVAHSVSMKLVCFCAVKCDVHLFCSRNSAEVITSLGDAVRIMQRTLMGSVEDRLVLNIRRSLLLIDALKEAKKEKFDVKKFVKVQA